MKAKIIDLSHNNADVQFHTLPVVAVFFKASQGSGFRDPAFRDRVARAREVGLRVGAYHFIDGSDSGNQLDNFLGAIHGLGPVLHALDFETNPSGGNATASIAGAMIEVLVQDYSRHPIIYGSDFLPKLAQGGYGKAAALCPLWEARYSSHQPTPPPPWTAWDIWQYSEVGPILVGGVERLDIDLSVYNPAKFKDDDAFTQWWDARMVTVA